VQLPRCKLARQSRHPQLTSLMRRNVPPSLPLPSSPHVFSTSANASLTPATSRRVACSLSRPSRVASSCSFAPALSLASSEACSLRSFLRSAGSLVRSSGDCGEDGRARQDRERRGERR
jgi:hypothetical protein